MSRMGSMGSVPIEFDTWYEEQHPLVLAALTVASGRPDVAADATDDDVEPERMTGVTVMLTVATPLSSEPSLAL